MWLIGRLAVEPFDYRPYADHTLRPRLCHGPVPGRWAAVHIKDPVGLSNATGPSAACEVAMVIQARPLRRKETAPASTRSSRC
jgi:hypothetical protein